MTMFFEAEEDPEFAIKAAIQPFSEAAIHARYETSRRRLNSRCKGLLEVHECGGNHLFCMWTVDFLHRTVRDFLLTDEMQQLLKDYSGGHTFDVHIFLCKSYLAQSKALETLYAKSEFRARQRCAAKFTTLLSAYINNAAKLESSTDQSPIHLLNESGRITAIYRKRLIQMVEGPETGPGSMNSIIVCWAKWRDWECSFLALATLRGLHIYVKEKIMEDPDMLTEERGRPLLEYALRPSLGHDKHRSPHFNMARFMPEQGANPNQNFNGDTLWELFEEDLDSMGYMAKQKKQNMAEHKMANHKWCELAKLIDSHVGVRMAHPSCDKEKAVKLDSHRN